MHIGLRQVKKYQASVSYSAVEVVSHFCIMFKTFLTKDGIIYNVIDITGSY